MMKFIIQLSLVAFLIASCAEKKNVSEENSNKDTIQIIQNIENDTIMLLGEITKKQLQPPNYSWYDENYKFHSVNDSIISSVSDKFNSMNVEVFMGTWCEDSHMQVPAFFKILEKINFPENQLKIFAMDEDKNMPSGYEKEKSVLYAPTFIFYKDGVEVGRIVESPINSLEADMRDIANGIPQTPNYAE